MSKKIYISLFITISFLLSNSANTLLSQTIKESVKVIKAVITGTVIGEDEMPLPGVSISLTSKTSGITLTAITSEDGTFRFAGLTPFERYRLEADLSGFTKATIEEIYVTNAGEIGGYGQIDIIGNIGITNLKSATIIEDISQPDIRIREITINENLGLDPINHEETEKEKSAVYFANNKIFAKQGIAEIGVVEEKLSNITEFPYKDEDYAQTEMNLKENCVYAIRIGDDRNQRTMLIRIISILENKIAIKYLVGD